LTLTNHAKLRMNQRQITLQDVFNCVIKGTPENTKNGLTKYTYQNIYVIINTEKNIVVTTCFIQAYTKQIKKYAKINSIGFYQAVRMLRSCLNAV